MNSTGQALEYIVIIGAVIVVAGIVTSVFVSTGTPLKTGIESDISNIQKTMEPIKGNANTGADSQVIPNSPNEEPDVPSGDSGVPFVEPDVVANSDAPSGESGAQPETQLEQTFYRVFVSSAAYQGDLGGVIGADAKCQALANTAGLGGSWIAYLGSSTVQAKDRLYKSLVPYKLLDGTLIANNWADLADGSIQNPINLTEFGILHAQGNVRTGYQYKSGSINAGSSSPEQMTCDNWTTSEYGNGYSSSLGMINWNNASPRTFYTDRAWYYSGWGACSIASYLYCIEQPSAFDWRNKDGYNWLTPAKSQGDCPSCWAFAAVGVMEAKYKIQENNPNLIIDLSEKYLLSYGAYGGVDYLYNPFPYIENHGISNEECCPYLYPASEYCYFGYCPKDLCKNGSPISLWKILGYGFARADREGFQQALVEKGPLYVRMGGASPNPSRLDNRNCPIYDCSGSDTHSVVLVGYDNASQYWIIKDTYGVNPSQGPCYDGFKSLDYTTCAVSVGGYIEQVLPP